ncbi:MAG: hypothetical protein CL908_04930 [Deltaproteobacteria bacterium]|jgi:hypothetical protein|nr:hypothetical protein [Deltaproteobacteria bacterium]
MSGSRLRFFTTLASFILLLGAEASQAQPQNFATREYIWNEVDTIRVFTHPSFTSSGPILEIFLKDPKAPGFWIGAKEGDTASAYDALYGLGSLFKHGAKLIYDPTKFLNETNAPDFDRSKHYNKKMHRIYGFYLAGGGIQGGYGGAPTPKAPMTQVVPIPGGLQPPPGGTQPAQRGTCCVHGLLHELPADVCQNEGGVFYADRAVATRSCGGAAQ